MLPSLYVLAEDYNAAASQLADLELDEQTIADTLESMAGDVEVKATNVAMFKRNLEAQAAAIKEAEASMASRRKAIEKRAEQIGEYLLFNMQRTGITKIESPWFKLAVRNNLPSVIIDDPDKVPSDLYVYPEAPAPYPDKKAIAEKLKAGEEVTGAHLETKQRLEIK